jgi:anti-sigma B factor antagonist
MTLKITREEQYTLVKLEHSRLDAASAPQFRQQMREIIDADQRRLILDLGKVSFIDSSGLGALVATLKALEGGRELFLCGVTENVMHLFRLTHMDKVFRLYPDVTAAQRGG